MTSVFQTRGALQVFALGLALALTPATSNAQAIVTPPIPAGGAAPIGPLGVTSSVAWHSEYDDNIFRSATHRIPDIVSTFGGRTEVRSQMRRLGLSASGSADWVHYTKVGSERGANVGANVRMALLLYRVVPYVTGSYNNTRQRVNVEITSRPRSYGSNLGAGAVIQLGGKTGLDLSFKRNTLGFDKGAEADGVRLREALNRVSDAATVSLYQQATPVTRVMVAAELSRERFDVSQRRDADNLRFSAGYESEGRLAGYALAGLRVLKPLASDIAESRGFFASVGTGLTLFDRLQIGVSAEHDLAPSYRAVVAYYKYSSFGGSIMYAVHRSLKLSAIASRRTMDYESGIGGVSPQPLGADVQTEYGPGVSYLIGESLSIDFSGIYRNRTSPIASRLFDGSVFRVGVSHGF